MKKRIICSLLAAIFSIAMLPMEIFAAPTKSIESKSAASAIRVSQVTAKPGETVSVDITVENNPGIQGATLTLTWDSGLTLTEKPKNGEAFSVLNPTFPKKLSSPYNLFWYAQDLDTQDIKDGVIATLKFTVSPDAKSGDKLQIGVSYVLGDIVDQNKQLVSPTITNGFVLVESSEHTHAFNRQTASEKYLATAATCTEAATYYYSCECGEAGKGVFSYGNPLGHNFLSGECTRCHAAEPSAEICMIRVSQVTAKPGETVSVDITVENNPGIQGATLTLTWDSGLTLTEKPENGEAFSVLNPTFPKKLSSPYNLFWYAQDLDTQDIKDGVIATLKFTVSPDAKDGDKLQIGVSVFPGDIVDQKRTPVECKLISGAVCVSDPPVQTTAIQTAQTVIVSISSKIAVENAGVYLAEYSETGQYLGCALKTVDLRAGENSVTFSNVRSATEHKTFVTSNERQPLCAASSVEKQ